MNTVRKPSEWCKSICGELICPINLHTPNFELANANENNTLSDICKMDKLIFGVWHYAASLPEKLQQIYQTLFTFLFFYFILLPHAHPTNEPVVPFSHSLLNWYLQHVHITCSVIFEASFWLVRGLAVYNSLVATAIFFTGCRSPQLFSYIGKDILTETLYLHS